MTNETTNVIVDELYTPSTKKDKVLRDYKSTKTQVEYLGKYGNKSQAIRKMFHEEHLTKSQIADLLNIKYQHVRNVLNQIVKKS